MNRRSLLKRVGLSLGAAVLSAESLLSMGNDTYAYHLMKNPLKDRPLDKPVTAITLGAGNRGNVYGGYALNFPENLKIIGVAEPIPLRNERFSAKHNIPQEHRFDTWERVFERPKFADAVIITTPDSLHYAPCIKALSMGYDILLEKPIAQTEKECRDILAAARRYKRIVAVCHVLRYAPYFVKMRELLRQGAIGEIISVQHFEPIEHNHMAHSYVRGNWHNSKETTPIILAKSCHDLDIIRWLVDKPAKKISAMGDLRWFRKENAPAGSTERCTDNCAVERQCPYSAIKAYYERRERLAVFDLPEDKSQHADIIMERLKTTNYGRCVYRMGNDQPDHYVTNILFENNITASFSMEAFTSYHGRRTRIMGSMGDMVGDMNELIVNDFITRKRVKLVPKAEDVEGYKNSGHGGGDWLLAHDFVKAVSLQDPQMLTSTIDESIESHIMGFMAEKSRLQSKVMTVSV